MSAYCYIYTYTYVDMYTCVYGALPTENRIVFDLSTRESATHYFPL